MTVIAPAIFYALFVWWFSTGLVLMLVLRRKATLASLAGAALLFPLCLVALAYAARHQTVAGVYVAFTATIILWGTQEVAFLTGALTGPRPRACPEGARGFDRFCYAVSAILYHEIALAVSGAALLIVTMGQPNQTGVETFLVLWIMRLSAKLNLFLGVPVIHDEALPTQISFIKSYFSRGPTNSFLPIAMLLSVLLTWDLAATAVTAHEPAAAIDGILVATLLALAVIEHIFMVVPLPIDRIWQWSTRGAAPANLGNRATEVPSRVLEQQPGSAIS